ncbi:MAG: antibiotic biosynthesis monooxygenase, partial [Actinobacteria bacterium]|nr:antibiotic biosynthesis monooxygenase [Actinomycetota bacterium]
MSIAEIHVQPGDAVRFAARCHAALGHISGAPGYRSAKLTHSLADPARF